jgi:1,4-alpha-glucan branching enzyme
MSRPPAALAIVLHSHMPYVEGFGTWPFGEEWLWEAIACSYLPLLDVLDAAPGRVTLSVTPVLGDQLEAPGALERCLAFLRGIRPASHALDLPAATRAERAALEHSAARYAWSAEALARGDLAARMAEHATWTSSATHAILPLLATDEGIRVQLATGIAAHRARSGAWGGGLWLPECAHAPWLDPLLEEAGVHVTCVDLTDVAPEARAPLRSPAGPLLVPLDRPALELVWSRGGYPSRGAYRDTHRLTERRHQAWAVDGAAYEPERAAAQARADAAAFVAAVRARSGLCCVAWDTELLGLHWHEGVLFLAAVLEEAEAAGLRIAPLDVLAAEAEAAPAVLEGATSWGTPRTLDTWSAPRAGGLAWRQRRAELRALPGGSPRAIRELLALQSSDWAFLIAHGTAGDYPRERAAGHEAALAAALAAPEEHVPALRNLAPNLNGV